MENPYSSPCHFSWTDYPRNCSRRRLILESPQLSDNSLVYHKQKRGGDCSSTVAKLSGDTSKEKVAHHQHYDRAEFVSTLVLGD